MKLNDTRTLSPSAQEDLRQRVVRAVVKKGIKKAEAVRVFGVSYPSVHSWVIRYHEKGFRGLKSRRRGRPPEPRLTSAQRASIIRLITDRCPDQLKLPFSLWTREAVQQLIIERHGIHLSVWTVGRYLRRWGMTPQKPLRRAYEQDSKAVEQWLQTEYPAIRRRANRVGAQIQWGDEMGMRSDHQVGRSYGRRGQTPVIASTGQRFGCNMISTITNQGHLAFMVFRGRFTAVVMLKFLRRLLRQCPRPVFLIMDRHPVHRSAPVQRWVSKHAQDLQLFYLPGYSPELNPDELLNQDVKSNAVGRRRPRSQEDLEADVRRYLRSTQKQPAVVKNYFHGKHVTYASC
jgi:transposase